MKPQYAPTIAFDEASRFKGMASFHIQLENHEVIYTGSATITLLNVDESMVKYPEKLRMTGAPMGAEVPCTPIFSHWRQGSGLKSLFRDATSWFGRRGQEDVNRNRLAQR